MSPTKPTPGKVSKSIKMYQPSCSFRSYINSSFYGPKKEGSDFNIGSKNNSMIVDDTHQLEPSNNEYRVDTKNGQEKDLNNSFTYSNTSPRSLYSKMQKKSTQNLGLRKYSRMEGLNKSQDYTVGSQSAKSFVQETHNKNLNQSNFDYNDVEIEFADLGGPSAGAKDSNQK